MPHTTYLVAATAFDKRTGDYGDEKKLQVVYPFAITKLAPLLSGNILEIGSGNGAFCRYACRQGTNCDGLEINSELLARSKERDTKLQLSIKYFEGDAADSQTARIYSNYNTFISIFSLQDMHDPSSVIKVLEKHISHSFRFIVIIESYHYMTSRLIRHTTRRRNVPTSDTDGARFKSYIDWGGGEESESFCRLDEYYLNITSINNLEIFDFGYFGNSKFPYKILSCLNNKLKPFFYFVCGKS